MALGELNPPRSPESGKSPAAVGIIPAGITQMSCDCPRGSQAEEAGQVQATELHWQGDRSAHQGAQPVNRPQRVPSRQSPRGAGARGAVSHTKCPPHPCGSTSPAWSRPSGDGGSAHARGLGPPVRHRGCVSICSYLGCLCCRGNFHKHFSFPSLYLIRLSHYL